MSDLEALLRASELKHGRICLYTEGGRWYGAVTHFHGHQTQCGDQWQDDPVDALRVALIEDARRSDEVRRRYAAAEKMGSAAVADDDFEDIFS